MCRCAQICRPMCYECLRICVSVRNYLLALCVREEECICVYLAKGFALLCEIMCAYVNEDCAYVRDAVCMHER